jgi:hypothetical protein
VPDGWLEGEAPLVFEENGSTVSYKAELDNRTWLQHGGWKAPTPEHKAARNRVVTAVCLKVENWLKDA